MKLGIPLIVAAGLALLGCATIDAQLRSCSAEAKGVFGDQPHLVLLVPSDAPVFDAALDREGEGSPLGRQLGDFIAQGQTRAIRLAIGGTHPEQTKHIVLEALTRNRDNSLSGLVLLMCGDSTADSDIRHAVETAGGLYLGHRKNKLRLRDVP